MAKLQKDSVKVNGLGDRKYENKSRIIRIPGLLCIPSCHKQNLSAFHLFFVAGLSIIGKNGKGSGQ